MLERDPALVNTQPCKRWTALRKAAFESNVTMVVNLLAKRANPDATTSDGRRPLDIIGQNRTGRCAEEFPEQFAAIVAALCAQPRPIG